MFSAYVVLIAILGPLMFVVRNYAKAFISVNKGNAAPPTRLVFSHLINILS